MANETITVNVQYTDQNDTAKKRIRDAEGLRIENEKLSKLNMSNAKRAAYSEYGTARAIGSGTGAAGRDFGKEAQGLSGLVRLYAVYAANLFAAEAAFRALSNAADTSNMVKGLDQLGAQSGRSLGTLSKQLVDVTGGAISLKEAMTATAQATAAGMTSQNLIRLGTVARQASQALGIGLPDAVSRLSRGITKLEPELLDELGLFTKIDQSNQDYARSLGKTASSLTDFEKRQGFANSVLKEAEDKFGKLKIDVNPYDKLASSLANVSFQGLELINKVLAPIVDILSKSPLALTTVLAGIGAMILKQAIPAIGQYRAELAKAADASLLAVSGRSRAADQAKISKLRDLKQQAEQEAETYVTALDAAERKLKALKDTKFAQDRKKVSAILEKPVQEVSQEEITYLKSQAAKSTANKALQASYLETAAIIEGSQRAEERHLQTSMALAQQEEDIKTKGLSTKKQDEAFNKQSRAAAIQDIRARAAGNVEEMGFLKSVKQGWQEIIEARKGYTKTIATGEIKKDATGKKMKDEYGYIPETTTVVTAGITKMQVATGILGVTASAAASSLAKLFGAFARGGAALAVASIVFEFVNFLFSDSAKEADAYSKSMDTLSAAIDTVGATLNAIRDKSIDKILSVESVQARANAFIGLSDALSDSIKKLDELQKAQNGWDRFVDTIKRVTSTVSFGFSDKLFGGGIQRDMTKNLAGSIIASIRAAESGDERKKISAELSKIVGFDASTFDQQGLEDALNKLNFSQLESKQLSVSRTAKTFATEAANSAAALTAFQESVRQTAKDVDALTTSLAPTDPFGKIGVDLLTNSSKLVKALENPKHALEALKEVANSMQLVSLLPAGTQQQFIDTKQELTDITNSLGKAREAQLKAQEDFAKTSAKVKYNRTEVGMKTTSGEQQDADNIANIAARKAVEISSNILADLEPKAKAFAQKYAEGLSLGLFKEGVRYLDASLKMAMREGAIAAARGYLSVISSLGGATAKEETKLKLEELDIQKELIKIAYDARLSQERNTLATEENSLRLAKASEETKARDLVFLLQNKEKFLKTPESVKKAEEDLKDSLQKRDEIDKSIAINKFQSDFAKNPSIRIVQEVLKQPDSNLQKQALAGSPIVTATYAKANQDSKIEGQKKAVILEGRYKELAEEAKLANNLLDIEIRKSDLVSKQIQDQEQLLGFYSEELSKNKLSADLTSESLKYSKEVNLYLADRTAALEIINTKGIDSEKRNATIAALSKSEADFAQKTADYTNKKSELETKYQTDREAGLISIRKLEEDIAARKLKNRSEISTAELTDRETDLKFLTEIGAITQEQAAAERASIDTRKLIIDYTEKKRVLDIEILDIADKQAKLERFKQFALENGYTVDVSQDQDRLNRLKAGAQGSLDALERTKQSGQKAIDVTQSLADHSVGMEKVFRDSFMGMADALTEFAKTGKLNFSDLINNMLASLLKFELQYQMSALYAGLGPGGLMGAAKSFLGISPTTFKNDAGGTELAGSLGFAKGGAWDMGIQKFAQGGAFSNQIVTNPTMFKFASGTGLMGEAGPEAIMPLKRDGKGNLGVTTGASHPKVDVVVNNYSNQQATTNETVDSRGNRKIEVIVGDMVADQIGRAGSNAQQAMTMNYGARPTLVRR